jgi:hypothetical protein
MHARTWRRTGLDLVTEDDLDRHGQQRSGRVGRGETGVEQDRGVALGACELARQALDVVEERDVERRIEGRVDVPDRRREGQVRVRLDHARHDRAATGVEQLVVAMIVQPPGAHLDDPVALDDDLARRGLGAAAVEDQSVGEDRARHRDPTFTSRD